MLFASVKGSTTTVRHLFVSAAGRPVSSTTTADLSFVTTLRFKESFIEQQVTTDHLFEDQRTTVGRSVSDNVGASGMT